MVYVSMNGVEINFVPLSLEWMGFVVAVANAMGLVAILLSFHRFTGALMQVRLLDLQAVKDIIQTILFWTDLLT